MNELPDKLYFRRGEVRRLFGFSEEAMTKLVRAGTLKPSWLEGDKQAYFARTDLIKLLPHQAVRKTEKQPMVTTKTKTTSAALCRDAATKGKK